MQAIEPIRQVQAEPRSARAFGRRFGVSVMVVVTGLTLVAIAGDAERGLRDAEQRVVRSFEESIASIGATRTASATLTHLRADLARLRIVTNQDERVRLEDRIAERHRWLAADIGAIVARARSARASEAAAAAQIAVTAWQEATQSGAVEHSSGDASDRLAIVAEAKVTRLARSTAWDDRAARKGAEADVADRITIIEGIIATIVGLVLLVAWIAIRRTRRAIAAAEAVIERLAVGGITADSHEAGSRELGALYPALTRLGEAVRYEKTKLANRDSANDTLAKGIAAARDAVILVDATGRIAYANAPARALLGAAANDLRSDECTSRMLATLPAADGDGASEIRLADGRWLGASRNPMPDGGYLLVLSDIGDRKRREARSNAAAANLRTALDAMSQGLCLFDASRRLVVANRRYEEIYRQKPGALQAGISATEVFEHSMAAGNHPGQTLGDLLGEASAFFERIGRDDHFQELAGGRIVQINGGPTADGGFVATYDDVTERWHAESRIAYMARHDGLTDLPNRVLLAERIEGAITQASRDSGFAVHCLDLDNFKQINDTLGHAVGDELLHAVAHRLTACLREVDTVARLGGDEFAIVQAGVGKPEDAAILARHVIDVVSAPYELADHSVTIGVSIGIALAPADGMAPDRLLKNADVALYKSKDDGRGVFRFFEPEMDARLQARRLLEIDLRAAMAAEAFELHYQPIYDLSQDRICGFEALLRWTHPTRGRVSPAEFVPLAEEIGLIVPLGEWVLRRACAEASGWPGDLKIAVNVSPAQFRSAQLIRTVREALSDAGLAANRLELEITETVLLANRGATVAILHALRCLGARISMDDFGTGYSSLSYLRSFPFDKMKIDQSFIRDLTVENGSGFIVKAVISLGSSLGMTLTAEGVETEDQLARLRDEGCDEVQGYLFSPPVPVSQIAGLLEKWNGPAGIPAEAA